MGDSMYRVVVHFDGAYSEEDAMQLDREVRAHWAALGIEVVDAQSSPGSIVWTYLINAGKWLFVKFLEAGVRQLATPIWRRVQAHIPKLLAPPPEVADEAVPADQRDTDPQALDALLPSMSRELLKIELSHRFAGPEQVVFEATRTTRLSVNASGDMDMESTSRFRTYSNATLHSSKDLLAFEDAFGGAPGFNDPEPDR